MVWWRVVISNDNKFNDGKILEYLRGQLGNGHFPSKGRNGNIWREL